MVMMNLRVATPAVLIDLNGLGWAFRHTRGGRRRPLWRHGPPGDLSPARTRSTAIFRSSPKSLPHIAHPPSATAARSAAVSPSPSGRRAAGLLLSRSTRRSSPPAQGERRYRLRAIFSRGGLGDGARARRDPRRGRVPAAAPGRTLGLRRAVAPPRRLRAGRRRRAPGRRASPRLLRPRRPSGLRGGHRSARRRRHLGRDAASPRAGAEAARRGEARRVSETREITLTVNGARLAAVAAYASTWSISCAGAEPDRYHVGCEHGVAAPARCGSTGRSCAAA